MTNLRILALLTSICFTSLTATALQCTVTGEVIGRNSSSLLIRKCSESSKMLFENPVLIPIIEGRFKYTFSYSDVEAYELVFQDELEINAWRAIVFFPATRVELILYPKADFSNNVIQGGPLNSEYGAYQLQFRNLFEAKDIAISNARQLLQNVDDYESEEYKLIRVKLRETKPDDYDARTLIYQTQDEMEKTRARYTEKGKMLMNRQDSLELAKFNWKYSYIVHNVSLASYYLMWDDVVMQVKNNSHVAKLVADAFPAFAKKYPAHVYTSKIRVQLSGLLTISLGNKYIDFEAPDFNGDKRQLSVLIKNKIALIDLWGSWCGPCIAKSRLVVPIYNAYKDKGFEVVSIAREFKTTEAWKRRLSKEQFSWINLVELDDKQNIWNQYGISNGTGLMVLVDKDGTILAVDPKPEELEKILKEKL